MARAMLLSCALLYALLSVVGAVYDGGCRNVSAKIGLELNFNGTIPPFKGSDTNEHLKAIRDVMKFNIPWKSDAQKNATGWKLVKEKSLPNPPPRWGLSYTITGFKSVCEAQEICDRVFLGKINGTGIHLADWAAMFSDVPFMKNRPLLKIFCVPGAYYPSQGRRL